MTAIDDLKKHFPNLTIKTSEDGFAISGTILDVAYADARMDMFIPTEYKRGMLAVFYETDASTRTYRKNHER